MIFKETLIKSLLFAVRVSRFSHMCRALLRFPHLSFMTPVPYPPLRGTFPSRGRLFMQSGEAATGPHCHRTRFLSLRNAFYSFRMKMK